MGFNRERKLKQKGEQEEKGKGGQMCGNEKRFDFWW